MRLSLVTVLAACASTTIPAARFTPHPDWTPGAYHLPAHAASPAAVLDRDAMIDDLAFLEHALAEAWPSSVVSTPEFARLIRDRGRELPVGGDKPGSVFCDELADAYHSPGLTATRAGHRCGVRRVEPTPVVRAIEIPADRNYAWHRDPGGAVGVLALQRFAPAYDPGWNGLGRALGELAATEFPVIDLQSATGDDPSVGFAVLAALALHNFERNSPRPMVARDTPMAEVVRGNFHALHPTATARSRALWQGFATPTAIVAAGRAVVDVERTARATKIEFVVGSGCAAACQMIVALAEFQDRVEVVSATGAEDQLDGDELGMIRLPHSGIEVTFPTVAYGTPSSGVMRTHGPGGDLVTETLQRSRAILSQRAERAAWDHAVLPDCRAFATDAAPLVGKRSGCFDATGNVGIHLMLGEERSREFLVSCGLTLGSTMAFDGYTFAYASGPREALDRLAHAAFVKRIEWQCPLYTN